MSSLKCHAMEWHPQGQHYMETNCACSSQLCNLRKLKQKKTMHFRSRKRLHFRSKKKKKRLHISEAEKGCAFQKQKKTAFQKQKITAFQNAQLPEVYCDRQMLALLSWGIWGWGLLVIIQIHCIQQEAHEVNTHAHIHTHAYLHMHTCTQACTLTHTPPTPTPPPPPPRYRLLVVTKSNLRNSCAIMVLLYFIESHFSAHNIKQLFYLYSHWSAAFVLRL